MQSVTTYQPDIIPGILYADVQEGIAFLERAFGFERHLVVAGEGDAIVHCEMRLGRGLVMCGSLEQGEHNWKTPREAGGVTSGIYVATSDVDARYQRALDGGATLFSEIHDTDYGSRDFTVLDPAGNRWSFGTYHPTTDRPDGSDSPITLPAEMYAATRYADAPAAIRFLRDAFGFEEQFVVSGELGRIDHAQLRFGSSLFMLGSARDDAYRMATPSELGGVVTQLEYVVVSDLDAHFARAKAAGAVIVRGLRDEEYGSRGYEARDLEGNLWSFGTYRPAPMPQA